MELMENGTPSRAPLEFEEDGFVIRSRHGLGAGQWVAYGDVTHAACSRWGLAIGTMAGISLLRRSRFESAESVVETNRELRERIAARPGGAEQLLQMDAAGAESTRLSDRGSIYGFIALCLVVQFLQFSDPAFLHVGSFIPSLVGQGEVWRVATANFLHDTLIFPLHILLNLICVFTFGTLVERTLGRDRAIVVLGASAVGAMWAAATASYVEVIGASGVAAGLVGSVLCLEFNATRSLPVWSRIPRRIFIFALIVQGMVDILVPFVAGAAHIGGFALGYLTTRLFITEGRVQSSPGLGVRRLAGATIFMVVVAIVATIPLLRGDPGAMERHGLLVLKMEDSTVRYDNEAAWRILTEGEARESGVQVAVLLALRAARRSDWRDPNVLDTLAEALFASGDAYSALEVIDQAIFLSRGYRYFVEQRQRFTGERDPDDRPAPPEEGWYRRLPDSLEEPDSEEPKIDPAPPGESIWI